MAQPIGVGILSLLVESLAFFPDSIPTLLQAGNPPALILLNLLFPQQRNLRKVSKTSLLINFGLSLGSLFSYSLFWLLWKVGSSLSESALECICRTFLDLSISGLRPAL